NHKELKFLKEQAIVYLFDNRDVCLIPVATKAKIIGTNHGFVYVRMPRGRVRELITRLMARLTLMGLIFPRIKYWHLFPGTTDRVGYSPKEQITLPLGIKIDDYNCNKGSGEVKFLFAGQLKEGKGINTVLEAWELGSLYKYGTLTVCGWGPLGDKLKESAPSNVFFKGFVTDRELREIFSVSDVFVYPTRGDTYGFVILEALASGMKVLTTKIMSGLFDDFSQKGFVEYVDDNIDAFSNAMVACAKNIRNIREESNSVRNMVKSEYDLKIISEKLFNYFRLIVMEKNE
ncbi:MAG: glycosyltransferase, partial [Conexivisphaerales archaeon]